VAYHVPKGKVDEARRGGCLPAAGHRGAGRYSEFRPPPRCAALRQPTGFGMKAPDDVPLGTTRLSFLVTPERASRRCRTVVGRTRLASAGPAGRPARLPRRPAGLALAARSRSVGAGPG